MGKVVRRETVKLGDRHMNACAARLASILDEEWRDMPVTRQRIRGLEKSIVLATLKALRAGAVQQPVAK